MHWYALWFATVEKWHCFLQQPLGNRYWSDVQAIDLPPEFETAYVQVEDTDFANRILDLATHFVDGHEAAAAIEEYVSRRNFKTKKRWAA